MEIGKPVPESKVPVARKRFKHIAVYEAVMKVPEGQVLPVTFDTDKQAAKFAQAISHTAFAKFKAIARENVVYVRLWNEKDDAALKHITELREKARARKPARV